MAESRENLLQRLRSDPVLLVWVLFGAWAIVIHIVPLIWQYLMYVNHGVLLGFSIYDRDFANYWVGGRLALSGNELTLFHHDAYFAHLKSLFGEKYQIHSWSYPPHYLLFMWPLGLLEYKTALAAFLLVTFAMFVASARVFSTRFAPGTSTASTAIALVAFCALMLWATQNGFLIASFMLVALACMRSRPWLAGLALACLTVKPQLGALFAVVVLLDRNWRVLAWTLAFGAGLVALSLLLFGLDCWQAYFSHVIPYQAEVMEHWFGDFLRLMPGMFGSLRTLGFAPGAALLGHAVFALAVLPAVIWLLVKLRDPLQRAFALLAGTFLVTPYAFNYDMGALSVVAALLAQTSEMRHGRAATLVIALVAVLPGVMFNLGRAHLPLSPLLLAAALAAVWHVGLRAQGAGRVEPARA